MGTREPQYNIQFESLKNLGPVPLGPTTSHLWRSDPKHLVFYLSRYKFVSKMLTGRKNVIEIGCGDAFGSTLLTQDGTHVHCTDFDPLFIEEARERERLNGSKTFEVIDFTTRSARDQYDAAFCLDVIEHIAPEQEADFIGNICASLQRDSILVIGTPSLESQVHASVWSKAGHVNCKSGEDWRRVFSRYFENVLLFSMNDEVVHTGYSPMAHYLFAVAVHPLARGTNKGGIADTLPNG